MQNRTTPEELIEKIEKQDSLQFRLEDDLTFRSELIRAINRLALAQAITARETRDRPTGII